MTQFNPEQFAQMVRFIPQPMLNQLVLQAQARGIDQTAIQEGLRYINQIKNPNASAAQVDNKQNGGNS